MAIVLVAILGMHYYDDNESIFLSNSPWRRWQVPATYNVSLAYMPESYIGMVKAILSPRNGQEAKEAPAIRSKQ